MYYMLHMRIYYMHVQVQESRIVCLHECRLLPYQEPPTTHHGAGKANARKVPRFTARKVTIPASAKKIALGFTMFYQLDPVSC